MIEAFRKYLRYELNRSPLTVEAYMRDILQFRQFFAPEPAYFSPSEVTPLHIRRWLSTLAEAGEAPASLRRKTQSLRAFFKFLCRQGILASNPAASIILAKLPKPLPNFIKDPDMLRLLKDSPDSPDSPDSMDSMDFVVPSASLTTPTSRPAESSAKSSSNLQRERDHLILHLLYATGLRRAELLSLTDASILPASRQIRVIGKGSKERVIPIADPLLDELRHWQAIRDVRWPHLPKPAPIIATTHGAMSAPNLEVIIKRLLANENAGRKSPHTLRHSFATSMINGGADLNSVRAILGHTSLATTQIYTHLQFSDLRAAYNAAHPRAKDSHTPASSAISSTTQSPSGSHSPEAPESQNPPSNKKNQS